MNPRHPDLNSHRPTRTRADFVFLDPNATPTSTADDQTEDVQLSVEIHVQALLRF